MTASPAACRSDNDETFELTPVPLWLEDYSALKALLDGWRKGGVTDLRAYLRDDPSRALECAAEIKVLKVNLAALAVFEARCGKGTYIRSLARDLGARLGCGALVAQLRRTRVGPFDAADGLTLETKPAAARSSLLPLSILSLPWPPEIVSLPLLAAIVSLPPLPVIVSASTEPERALL